MGQYRVELSQLHRISAVSSTGVKLKVTDASLGSSGKDEILRRRTTREPNGPPKEERLEKSTKQHGLINKISPESLHLS